MSLKHRWTEWFKKTFSTLKYENEIPKNSLFKTASDVPRDPRFENPPPKNLDPNIPPTDGAPLSPTPSSPPTPAFPSSPSIGDGGSRGNIDKQSDSTSQTMTGVGPEKVVNLDEEVSATGAGGTVPQNPINSPSPTNKDNTQPGTSEEQNGIAGNPQIPTDQTPEGVNPSNQTPPAPTTMADGTPSIPHTPIVPNPNSVKAKTLTTEQVELISPFMAKRMRVLGIKEVEEEGFRLSLVEVMRVATANGVPVSSLFPEIPETKEKEPNPK